MGISERKNALSGHRPATRSSTKSNAISTRANVVVVVEMAKHPIKKNGLSGQRPATRSSTKSNAISTKANVDVFEMDKHPIEKNGLSGQRPATRSSTKSNAISTKANGDVFEMDKHPIKEDGLSGQRLGTRSKAQSSASANVDLNNVTSVKSATKSKQKPAVCKTIAPIIFEKGEIVWCKLKGFNHWPAQIENFDKDKIIVRWFNDYRQSTVFRTQLFKFSSSECEKFSKKNCIALQTAIKEALIIYGRNKMS